MGYTPKWLFDAGFFLMSNGFGYLGRFPDSPSHAGDVVPTQKTSALVKLVHRCYAKINSQKQYNKSHRKWCEHHMTATTGVSLE